MLPSSSSQSHKATNNGLPPQLIPVQEEVDTGFEEIQDLELNDAPGQKAWLRGGFRPQWQGLSLKTKATALVIAILRSCITSNNCLRINSQAYSQSRLKTTKYLPTQAFSLF